MAEYLGSLVTVDCGDLGHFQGQLSAINPHERTVTLSNQVFKNGLPSIVPEVTLKSCDIRSIGMLKISDNAASGVSTVTRGGNRRNQRPVVDTSVPPPPLCESPMRQRTRCTSTGDSRTPKKNDNRNYKSQKSWMEQQKQTEECFGVEVDDIIAREDFDFEHTSHYDRVRRKMDFSQPPPSNLMSQTPDLVRLAESSHSKHAFYVTNGNITVPCLSTADRKRLFDIAEMHGFTKCKLIEMVGRAGCELSFQLMHTPSRLPVEFSQKTGNVVVLCGPHLAGAMALCAARHLASHNMSVSASIPSMPQMPFWLDGEIRLFRQTGANLVSSPLELVANRVDLVIWGMDEHELSSQQRNQPWYREALRWVNSLDSTPTLGIDPSASPPVTMTASLIPALPCFLEGNVGNLYLCDVGIPHKIFQKLGGGIRYASPFGHKFLIPIYQGND